MLSTISVMKFPARRQSLHRAPSPSSNAENKLTLLPCDTFILEDDRIRRLRRRAGPLHHLCPPRGASDSAQRILAQPCAVVTARSKRKSAKTPIGLTYLPSWCVDIIYRASTRGP